MSTEQSNPPAEPGTPRLTAAAATPVKPFPHHRTRVVIIGGGFGGLEATKKFAGEDVDVLLVDRSNHHLFQPLLYQVATAGLTPANIARPLREIFQHQKNVAVAMTEVRRIDVEKRKVITEDLAIDYDFLILATGARHSYFGHPEWEKHAPGLKSLVDAIEIRRRMLTAFEIAEKALDQGERDAAMTFVIVGGGPTGVEMAGAISEIARHTMTRDFRRIDPATAKIMIIEGAPHILSAYTADLSANGKRQLEQIGVEVHEGVMVTEVNGDGVGVKGGQFIPARTVIWAAGNAASPLGKSLGVEVDKAGRVIVGEDLTIPGHPEVQVIGDLAHCPGPDGKPLPGLSPVAMQQGQHAANNILETIAGGKPMRFEYWDKGTMATIGRNRAVADLRGLRFGGFLAWLTWAAVHVLFLVGFRSRVAVVIEWTFNYVTFFRGSRLVTGMGDGADALRHPQEGCEPIVPPDAERPPAPHSPA